MIAIGAIFTFMALLPAILIAVAEIKSLRSRLNAQDARRARFQPVPDPLTTAITKPSPSVPVSFMEQSTQWRVVEPNRLGVSE